MAQPSTTLPPSCSTRDRWPTRRGTPSSLVGASPVPWISSPTVGYYTLVSFTLNVDRYPVPGGEVPLEPK